MVHDLFGFTSGTDETAAGPLAEPAAAAETGVAAGTAGAAVAVAAAGRAAAAASGSGGRAVLRADWASRVTGLSERRGRRPQTGSKFRACDTHTRTE